MTVETPERAWTDTRLDDLSTKVDEGYARLDEKMEKGFAAADKKVDDGFARVDTALAEVNKKIDRTASELRGEMKAGFDKIDARFARADTRFYWLIFTLLAAALGIIGTMIGINAS